MWRLGTPVCFPICFTVAGSIAHPEKYNPEQYFQKSWSGAEFKNTDWVKKYSQI